MLLPIQTYGKAVLRQKAKVIADVNADISQLITNMFETMYAAEGIGLAAPQVDRSLRLFIIDLSPMEPAEGKRVYINPEILAFGEELDEYEEGCLSIPTVREIVTRPTTIQVRYQTLEGQTLEEEITDFLARVFQHEYDHLEGVLFTDRLSSLKRSLLKKTLKKIASGEIKVETSENFEL